MRPSIAVGLQYIGSRERNDVGVRYMSPSVIPVCCVQVLEKGMRLQLGIYNSP